MLVPKPIRKRVYTNLFNNGVVVAKKDYSSKHHEMKDVPNLMVIKLLQSLASRELVKEQFNWGWHYFFLKNEGIEYLRGFLHLPEEIVPNTLKKPKNPPREHNREQRGDRPPRRTGPGSDEKKAAPGGEFRPEFSRPSFGRGRGGRGGDRPEGGRDGYRRGGSGFSRGGGRGGAPTQSQPAQQQ